MKEHIEIRKTSILTISIIAFICIIFSCFMNIKLKNKWQSLFQITNNQFISIEKLESRLKSISINYWLSKQNQNVFQNNTELKKIINGKQASYTIGCYVHSKMCNSCIEKVFQDLSVLNSNINNDIQIILFFNKKEIIDNNQYKEYNFSLIGIDTFYFPAESHLESPLTFILDNKSNIMVPYTTEWLPSMYEDYFNKILPSFFEENDK